jgi:hypothetical protein
MAYSSIINKLDPLKLTTYAASCNASNLQELPRASSHFCASITHQRVISTTGRFEPLNQLPLYVGRLSNEVDKTVFVVHLPVFCQYRG